MLTNLFYGAGPEGIGCGYGYSKVVTLQHVCELCQCGGLAGTVYAKKHNDIWLIPCILFTYALKQVQTSGILKQL